MNAEPSAQRPPEPLSVHWGRRLSSLCLFVTLIRPCESRTRQLAIEPTHVTVVGPGSTQLQTTNRKILAHAEPPGDRRTRPRSRPIMEPFLPIVDDPKPGRKFRVSSFEFRIFTARDIPAALSYAAWRAEEIDVP